MARRFPIRALCVLTLVGGLAACSTALEVKSNDDGGIGGSGGSAGDGGTSGSGAGGGGGVAGIHGGTGGVSGVGGVGGISGVGGSGGVGGDCATRPPIEECPALAQGWFAVKTTLDVWWPSAPIRDPGRGEIEVSALAQVNAACLDDTAANVAIKLCDVTLPPITSDVFCEAYELTMPQSVWESPTMPRFETILRFILLSPGNSWQLTQWVGLLGIDLRNGNEAGTWPLGTFDGDLLCENGNGVACFVDHDNDGQRGITAPLRIDGETYVGPYDDGLCSNGTPYRYLAMPTALDLGAGGGGLTARARSLDLGLRTNFGVSGEISSDCNRGAGIAMATSFDLRAAACRVDPATLPPGDPRRMSLDTSCNADEARFVDRNMPAYQVLPLGAVPGDANPLAGWTRIGRDIDRTPSVGPRTRWVHMGSPNDVEPTCASVRNAVTTLDLH